MLDNLRALRQVMRDAKLSPPELDAVVHKRLEAVLISAYQHVPYYRELMQNAGYDPVGDYRGPQDLAKLPITTKTIIKQKGTRAFVREGSDLSHSFSDTTSGSTGIPLRVYRAPYERAVQIAKWLRVLFLNGYSLQHKTMALVSPGRATERDSAIQRLGILRRLTVDYVHHSPKEMADILMAHKPDVLYGNRSHLDLMALELKRRDIQVGGLQLLVGTAEVIHQNSRKLYRERFGVELIESYGSIEMGVMAYETPRHNGLDLCNDLTFFEFLDKDGKPVPSGEPGRVVVTDLTGELMPFIRYDQGDLAVFEYVNDMNGNTSQRIKKIIGRESDYALLPDGTRCSLYTFSTVIKKYENIMQYRVVQRTQSRFQILIVADTDYFLNIRDDLGHRLQQEFPPTVSFEIVQAERIEPDSSGKLKLLVSEVET